MQAKNQAFAIFPTLLISHYPLPSNRVISSLEGKFGTVGDTFVLVLEPLFMKI